MYFELAMTAPFPRIEQDTDDARAAGGGGGSRVVTHI
jgi:hypothetical protein